MGCEDDDARHRGRFVEDARQVTVAQEVDVEVQAGADAARRPRQEAACHPAKERECSLG
jgi:hypothetical protein